MERRVTEVKTALIMAGIVLLLVMIPTIPLHAAGDPPADASMVGSDVCADCHNEISTAFGSTVHGLGFAGERMSAGITCESCHGPGSAHAEDGEVTLIINPAGTNQFDVNQTCLGCHNTDKFDGWMFSTHGSADMNCSSCHKIHTDEHYKMKSTPDLCYDCHADVRAAFNMPSHHPVSEGRMECQTCHSIHGGDADFSQDFTTREMCFSCHPEKEGPFVYEHAPVSEDCMTCHTPHGTVANNLLKETEPVLCLNCHAMHFHATVESRDGVFTVPMAPERTLATTEDGWKRGMLTKCTQCHTEIHGTDMPSQAVSTGGSSLTR